MQSSFHSFAPKKKCGKSTWVSPSQRARRWLNAPLSEKGPLGWILLPLLWTLSVAVGVWALGKRKGLLTRGPLPPPPPFPTLCVGNVAMGGTGKSPIVQLLAQELDRLGYVVTIITNGYKKTRGHSLGDEAAMFTRHVSPTGRVQVVESPHRARTLGLFLQEWKDSPELRAVLLDDGLQSVTCPRTHNLVVWDPHLLLRAPRAPFPLGPYREGIPGFFGATVGDPTHLRLWSRCLPRDLPAFRSTCTRALAKVGLTPEPSRDYIVTKSCGLVLVETSAPTATMPTGPLAALCGVGHPDQFFSDVEETLGRPVEAKIALGDHGALAPPLGSLLTAVEGVITTEKDWARWQGHPLLAPWVSAGRLWVLTLHVELLSWDGTRASIKNLIKTQ